MTQQALAIAVQGIGFAPTLVAVQGFTATGVAPTNDLTSAKYQQSRAQKLRANLGVKWGNEQKREETISEPLVEQPAPEPVPEPAARRTLVEGGLRLTLAATQPKIDEPAPAAAAPPTPVEPPKPEPADLAPLVKKLFKRIQAAEDATVSLERRMTEHVDTLRRRLQESEDQRIAAERLVVKLMRDQT